MTSKSYAVHWTMRWTRGGGADSCRRRRCCATACWLLEAGHSLEEAQVSLLLRTAIFQRKGMLTALKYQTDPERTAVILADALLAAPPATLSLDELDRLRREDNRSAAWLAALPAALVEETNSADAARRLRAAELLEELRTGWPVPAAPGSAHDLRCGRRTAAIADTDWDETPSTCGRQRRLLACLAAAGRGQRRLAAHFVAQSSSYPGPHRGAGAGVLVVAAAAAPGRHGVCAGRHLSGVSRGVGWCGTGGSWRHLPSTAMRSRSASIADVLPQGAVRSRPAQQGRPGRTISSTLPSIAIPS